jgi:hypothetical protein
VSEDGSLTRRGVLTNENRRHVLIRVWISATMIYSGFPRLIVEKSTRRSRWSFADDRDEVPPVPELVGAVGTRRRGS